ncbi:MAG: hypothetical protein KBS41_00670 [Oscillospiraceae bacterium]|nr:hypothetical protein [Candidatus Equicaccousia limihippi]
MYDYKRVTIVCGHYGSGKTNVAVNMAYDLNAKGKKVNIADLDIVNPYFRTKDSAKGFEKAGINLICSDFACSNLDIPALPQEIYALTDDRSRYAVMDIGGDDRGAFVLGRLAPKILEENDYDMLFVFNKYRPLTPDAQSALEVMGEIEAASGIKFTGIINNSNIGEETVPQDLINSYDEVNKLSALSKLPVVLTTAKKTMAEQMEDVFPLSLQTKII